MVCVLTAENFAYSGIAISILITDSALKAYTFCIDRPGSLYVRYYALWHFLFLFIILLEKFSVVLLILPDMFRREAGAETCRVKF